MNCQKNLFDIPDDICYLNTAYMSPLPKEAMEIGVRALRKKLRPYEMDVRDFFEPVDSVKKSFAHLIGIDNHQRNVIIPSVSYGIANAVNNIPFAHGDEIVLASEQFPSNVYPWMELAKQKGGKIITINSPSDLNRKGYSWSERIMDAINSKTKIVALPHVHWSEGIIFHLQEISEKVHTYGGYLIVDGTQSIGALPFDVCSIQPDALIVAGYKWLMGPYGIGLAYYNDRFDMGKPVENNWINRLNSEDFAGLVNYQEEYKPYSNRFGVGESSNFASIPVLQYALDKILEWKPENIQEYCGKITDEAINMLKDHGFKICDKGQRSNHLFGIQVPESMSTDNLKSVFKKNKISVSFRGNFIRVSPFIFNNTSDLRFLADTLVKMKAPTIA